MKRRKLCSAIPVNTNFVLFGQMLYANRCQCIPIAATKLSPNPEYSWSEPMVHIYLAPGRCSFRCIQLLNVTDWFSFWVNTAGEKIEDSLSLEWSRFVIARNSKPHFHFSRFSWWRFLAALPIECTVLSRLSDLRLYTKSAANVFRASVFGKHTVLGDSLTLASLEKRTG